ncbi:MAG: hypothetical protein DKM50_03895 [Candidatus Margulisiibacteriota bacterium]|nr:MAG: hypothetical protein DKM50_03895 [Candidatus Margulisiibacteriota bacterium]HAR62976.1 hypothetical protein [Candidatus Margulisiibacteriota bacterium]HCY36987.1 hypothetical protein [Candidatus Margulisiibacteriota bacterium]
MDAGLIFLSGFRIVNITIKEEFIMGMRINYNGAANNAWRNLGVSQDKLTGSVEKLSSGLRINKGADDPAGLIISERLKSQITGLGQAIKNAQEATSLVQTAEGALTEMNNMLNKMRGLAVHSANSGVNDTDTIAADQRQVDSALDSLQKIAQNTKYQSKILLDGSSSNAATFSTSTYSNSISAIDIQGSADTQSGSVTFTLTARAERANIVASGFSSGHAATTLTIESSDFAAQTIAIAANATATATAAQVNNFYSQTGVWASVTGGSTSSLSFTFSSYGSDHSLTVKSSAAGLIGGAGNSEYAAGQDADGYMVGNFASTNTTLQMTGTGLSLTVDSNTTGLTGTKLTLVGANAGVTTERAGVGNYGGVVSSTSAVADLFSVTEGSLKFSLGQDANSTEIRSLAISNMQVAQLGSGVTGLSGTYSLNSIRTGSGYELSKDAANAVKIIDKAIDDVSITRANLGAFQQNALETTITTLSINKENLESSNSRIRDVDMAQEMMDFTKNQILTQAGTAMLAQANQLPQSVLQLLGR